MKLCSANHGGLAEVGYARPITVSLAGVSYVEPMTAKPALCVANDCHEWRSRDVMCDLSLTFLPVIHK